MRRLDAFACFSVADRRFYEDLGRANLTYELETAVRALGGEHLVTVNGVWVGCRPAGSPEPLEHGWKIHISATPANVATALRLVCAEFPRSPFHFKILRDVEFVRLSVSRIWPAGQVGKVITIYPTSADDCRDLLARLHPVLHGIEGPYIRTDQRYRDSRCLSYRYGGIAPATVVTPDGQHREVLGGPGGEAWEDDRRPTYRTPPWITELFPIDTTQRAGGPPKIGDYLVKKAIRHTGASGVYLAERIATGTPVVLKEARPGTEVGSGGTDGTDRLRAEFETLTRLADTGVVPRPIELFHEWEHLFLAEQYLDAEPLTQFISARNPLAHGDLSAQAIRTYVAEMDHVLAGIRAAVAACHAEGIAHGDLSPGNVMVCRRTLRVWLVDFESSRPVDSPQGLLAKTPGYCPRDESATGTVVDEFAVDSIEAALVFPRNHVRELSPTVMARTNARAADVLGRDVTSLHHRLELVNSIELPDIDLVIKKSVEFIHAVADTDRPDRIFPADPAVFGTNPWSVAHGAAGVLRALHRITGEVPAALLRRIDSAAKEFDRLPAGLYFGTAGVGWTLLDAGHTDRGLALIDQALTVAENRKLPADVATGSAGLGLACLAAWRRTGTAQYLRQAERIGRQLADSALETGDGLRWSIEKPGRHPVGYAHGSSGVALFLLYLHLATGEPEFLATGRRALSHDIAQANAETKFPSHVGGKTQEPYWLRGSAGVGVTLARYCRVEPSLRATLDALVRACLSGMTLFPGLFMGMAGLVNLGLDCAELLDEPEYRRLAGTMAETVLAMAVEQPEGIVFPGDGLIRASTDFATGSAGIVLTLDRLARDTADFNYTLDEQLPDSPPLRAAPAQ